MVEEDHRGGARGGGVVLERQTSPHALARGGPRGLISPLSSLTSPLPSPISPPHQGTLSGPPRCQNGGTPGLNLIFPRSTCPSPSHFNLALALALACAILPFCIYTL